MKLKLPLVAAFAALLTLSACGGGGGGSSSSSAAVASPALLSYTDTVKGTGATATTAGKTVNVTYTGWLYSDTATDHKGTQFDTGTFSFTLGTNAVIPGFEQGVIGMAVGGTRVVLIPSGLGYGSAGSPPAIPGNAGLVFQITLNSVQ